MADEITWEDVRRARDARELSHAITGREEWAAFSKTVKAALRRRSGKSWSVTMDRGTAWGWTKIDAPDSRKDDDDSITAEESRELHALLGLPNPEWRTSVSCDSADWDAYVRRARGEPAASDGGQF